MKYELIFIIRPGIKIFSYVINKIALSTNINNENKLKIPIIQITHYPKQTILQSFLIENPDFLPTIPLQFHLPPLLITTPKPLSPPAFTLNTLSRR